MGKNLDKMGHSQNGQFRTLACLISSSIVYQKKNSIKKTLDSNLTVKFSQTEYITSIFWIMLVSIVQEKGQYYV
jgi:hypothetical protein